MADHGRINGSGLSRLLGNWISGSGPLHRQLSSALRDLIELGELPPSTRLPSERSLAETLAISRTTVVTAYQALRHGDLISSRQGSGTFVRPPDAAAMPVHGPAGVGVLAGETRMSAFPGSTSKIIDLTSAAVPGLPLVADVAGSLRPDDYLGLTEGHGYAPKGLPELRQAVARWYAEAGVPTTSDQILVTSGAQQALELVAAACLDPGDTVVLEDPSYRGALQAFRTVGARLRTVPTDERGADVGAVEVALRGAPPRFVYVLPTAHNPTGAVMPDALRARLVEHAVSRQVLLIDDGSTVGTVFRGPTPPPLAAYAPDGPIVTIGSMSKVFWGGLRVGWIRAQPPLIARLARVKGVSDLGTSLISQMVALRLLTRHAEAVELRQRQLLAGYELLTGLLAEALPAWSWQEPLGGASLWVRLPQPIATGFAQLALRHGVAIVPGPVFSAAEHCEEHLRLPYAVSPGLLQAGVRRLAGAWAAWSPGHHDPLAEPQLVV